MSLFKNKVYFNGRMLIRWVFLFLLWIVILSFSHPDSFATFTSDDIVVKIDTLLTIGAGADGDVEYIFENPTLVEVDTKGKIYVADAATMTVRVFDQSGEFLASVGGRGAGPGEFQHLTAMAVDDHDHLLVIDYMNARITRFTRDYQIDQTFRLDHGVVTWPRALQPLPSRHMLMLYKQPRGGRNLLHSFTRNFAERTCHWGGFEAMWSTADLSIAQQWVQLRPGSTALTSQGDLLFAPSIYSGRIYLFPMDEGCPRDDARLLEGKAISGGAVTELTREPFPEDAHVFRSREGTAAGMLHSGSLGIFSLRDGTIAHFVYRSEEDERELGVEVFDETGVLQGYGVLEAPVPYRAVLTAGKNDEDRFYLIDRREYPRVHVVTLTFDGSS